MQENYRLGGAFKWPSLHEVLEYRRQVHDMVVKVIETAPLELPITQDHPWVRYNDKLGRDLWSGVCCSGLSLWGLNMKGWLEIVSIT